MYECVNVCMNACMHVCMYVCMHVLHVRLGVCLCSSYYSDDVDLFFCASENIVPSAEKLLKRGADPNALVCAQCLYVM